MWLHPVRVKKNAQKYILSKLCLTPEIKSKYFRTGECVGIGQTTVVRYARVFSAEASNKESTKANHRKKARFRRQKKVGFW